MGYIWANTAFFKVLGGRYPYRKRKLIPRALQLAHVANRATITICTQRGRNRHTRLAISTPARGLTQAARTCADGHNRRSPERAPILLAPGQRDSTPPRTADRFRSTGYRAGTAACPRAVLGEAVERSFRRLARHAVAPYEFIIDASHRILVEVHLKGRK